MAAARESRGGHGLEDACSMAPSSWSSPQIHLCHSRTLRLGMFNPRPGRVYQGLLEDFYLVQAMQAVSMKPQCIRDIFANMQFSNPALGMFILRLYKHAQWMPVVIDGRVAL